MVVVSCVNMFVLFHSLEFFHVLRWNWVSITGLDSIFKDRLYEFIFSSLRYIEIGDAQYYNIFLRIPNVLKFPETTIPVVTSHIWEATHKCLVDGISFYLAKWASYEKFSILFQSIQ